MNKAYPGTNKEPGLISKLIFVNFGSKIQRLPDDIDFYEIIFLDGWLHGGSTVLVIFEGVARFLKFKVLLSISPTKQKYKTWSARPGKLLAGYFFFKISPKNGEIY